MSRRTVWALLAVAVIAIVSVVLITPGSDLDQRHKTLMLLSDDVEFVSSCSSDLFDVRGIVTLQRQTEYDTLVSFEVIITSASTHVITGLLATAKIDQALESWGRPGQLFVFGLMDELDLDLKGDTRGLILTRMHYLSNPRDMSRMQRQRFYQALQTPILLGLWHDDGHEYLQLNPDAIEYRGFPGLNDQ